MPTQELQTLTKTNPKTQKKTCEYQTKNGKNHGAYTLFHSNGTPSMQSQYQEGTLHGPLKVYAKDGNLLCETPYQDGKKEGTMTIYRGKKVSQKKQYAKDVLHGDSENYGESGKVTLRTPYVRGDKHGDEIAYDEKTSQVVKKVHYEFGQKEGKWLVYYPNGTLYEDFQFVGDQKNGECRVNHMSGEPKEIAQFQDGELIQKKVYDESGKVIEEFPESEG